jgi:hypothetical protein
MNIELNTMMSIDAKSERNDGFCDTELAEIRYTRQRESQSGS